METRNVEDNNFVPEIFDGRIRLIPGRTSVKEILMDMLMLEGSKEIEEAFYTCNLGAIVAKHIEWINFLPRVKPFYAVKCNDDSMILAILANLGTGFDCASKREMTKVIEMGVDPDAIIFANPAKQNSHIRAALDLGVRTMTFDNEYELHKIKNIFPDAKLLIRLRCDANIAQCQLGMKFGVLVDDAPQLLELAKNLRLNIVGVSFHVGSGCMDAPVFARAIASAEWLFNIGKELGFKMTLLDIGGGFPGNSGTSIAEIANIVNISIDKYFPKGCGVEIIAEPGRFYAASAFTLTAKIHSMREVKGANEEKSFMYYINDGVYGSFNCVLYDHAIVYPETFKEISDSEALYQCSIWGPTCDGLDQVCSSVTLPQMELGDWLLFNDMGAYTIAAAGTFNGFPVPKVHYVATREALNILRLFASRKNYPVIDDVQLFTKADVGCNRDAVGWTRTVKFNAGEVELLPWTLQAIPSSGLNLADDEGNQILGMAHVDKNGEAFLDSDPESVSSGDQLYYDEYSSELL